MLKNMTKAVIEKIVFELLIAILLKKSVIIDLFSFKDPSSNAISNSSSSLFVNSSSSLVVNPAIDKHACLFLLLVRCYMYK